MIGLSTLRNVNLTFLSTHRLHLADFELLLPSKTFLTRSWLNFVIYFLTHFLTVLLNYAYSILNLGPFFFVLNSLCFFSNVLVSSVNFFVCFTSASPTITFRNSCRIFVIFLFKTLKYCFSSKIE